MRIRKFKDFKRRQNTRIKRVEQVPCAFKPISNQQNPAPAVEFPITKLSLS